MISPQEAAREALEALYDGADDVTADALLDQLCDRGYRLVPTREAERRVLVSKDTE